MADEDVELAAESRAFAFQVIAQIEASSGLAFKSIFEQDLEPNEIRRQAHALILAWAEEKQSTESADSDWPLAGQQIDMRAAIFGEGDVNITPPVALSEYNYDVVKTYRGNQVNEWVRTVCNSLALLRDGMTAGEAAWQIIQGGLIAFATAFVYATVQALRAGQALRAAVVTGVKAMGKMSVLVGVAMTIVVELLIYLAFTNKKVFLGLFYNNSNLNLVVRDWRDGVSGADKGDLYFETGQMTTFMQGHLTEKLDSPFVQIPAKFDVGDKEDNVILSGIFCAEKKVGFFGTEGAMAFTNHSVPPAPIPRFGALFACPYNYDNGVNVAVQTSGGPTPAKEFYKQLYNGRGMERRAGSGGYILSAVCSAPRGGEVCGMYFLDGPA